MKTLSPQTIGVEFPGAGSGTLQRTFWFVLQCNGRFVSWQTPLPSGPRQAGQFAPNALVAAAASISQTQRMGSPTLVFLRRITSAH